ncbi:MAG: HsdR family type I site-specific deoxyribonuclease, partial [Methanomicrobia archaeon]|nr:HsdR family type I site-specific deoxyribonuclease [Methanomicrobia archaeon]
MEERSEVKLTEDEMVEKPAINWLKKLGYAYIHGSNLSPEKGERESYRHVILKKRFIEKIRELNPWLTKKQAESVYDEVTDIDHPDFVMKSKIFYDMFTNGVKLKIRERGRERVKIVKLADFEKPENNDFLAANQFTVEYQYQNEMYRRPDLVIFINGIPIAVFEFKNFNANETAKDAFYDHKNKKEDIPQLYVYAQILVVSDGLETKYGSVTSDWDRFFVWEGIFDDDDLRVRGNYYIFKKSGEEMTSLKVLLNGLFRKEHLMDYLQDFILYEKSGESYVKKIAMFQQFYATRKAVERTKKAVLEGKTVTERRIGVIWHTQGSGKSLTMLFYARKVLKVKELENPLLLFITDRRNLDEQLYGVFASALPIVKRARSISNLQKMIRTTAGGIIFATIQKFGKRGAEEYPFLTSRKNIIVVADEAHRSQYKELAMNLRKAIPNASFMGFTATPIELKDRSTTLVFGKPISIYSMEKARRHGVVVPIYYEARLPKLHLTNEFIDKEFEELS